MSGISFIHSFIHTQFGDQSIPAFVGRWREEPENQKKAHSFENFGEHTGTVGNTVESKVKFLHSGNIMK